ncbi:hypothetical protein PVAP13_2KG524105 [Panicum virgatum]|uniref:PB1-like domain-containing protein n=1 Tax=Panicum virgatum TaxID=38727 RepID=A0A8T0WKR7_PANVG|nr:hypothetical protein PVAP13_2KG524105 [Panicum virgatum]
MDVLDTLAVRFHFGGAFVNDGKKIQYVGGFGGAFVNDGKKIQYVGGSQAMSYIERDKVSLPEIVGHLRDHWNMSAGGLLHWLFPGKRMEDGLRVLVDDNACLYMANCIVECGVADIFVEDVVVEKGSGDESDREQHVTDFKDELVDMQEKMTKQTKSVSMVTQSREEVAKQIKRVHEFYRGPTKKGKEVVEKMHEAGSQDDGSDESEDSDYMPGDASSS